MNRLPRPILSCLVFLFAILTAHAQFTVVGPAPFSEAVARQKIRTLLTGVDPGSRQKTIETLNGWAVWYRNLIDDELIAAWQKDTRANLTELISPLADARVASAVVEYSWRQQPEAALSPAYAPMLGDLMERFADSGKPFLDDLLGAASAGHALPLTQPEAETVCRILIDMPDVGTWRKDALRILPYYRRIAEDLLNQDLHGSDREKSYRADMLLRELRPDSPDTGNQQPTLRRTLPRPQPASVDRTPPPASTASAQASDNSARTPAPLPPLPQAAPASDGPASGTLSCSGAPIPQNAEYVFRNLPAGKLQLDYDTKNWDARLISEGQTQKLILRNKGAGPQKRCVVHWSINR